MRLHTVLVMSVLAASCGTNFAGEYKGTLSWAGSCSDGSSGTSSITVDWTIDGANGWVLNAGTCTGIELNDSGTVLTVATSKTCPPSANNLGGTTTNTFTGGTIALNGEVATVNLALASVITSSTASANCSGPMTGSLTRQK